MSLDISLYDKVCPHCGAKTDETICLFDANITHNLNKMAEAAGFYYEVWRPDDIDIEEAGDIIHALTTGIEDMEARPYYYRKYDSPNGWGTYDNFLPWLKELLEVCNKYPNAKIEVSR